MEAGLVLEVVLAVLLAFMLLAALVEELEAPVLAQMDLVKAHWADLHLILILEVVE